MFLKHTIETLELDHPGGLEIASVNYKWIEFFLKEMYLLEFFNVKETTKDLIVFNVFLSGCMKLVLETSVMPVSCL